LDREHHKRNVGEYRKVKYDEGGVFGSGNIHAWILESPKHAFDNINIKNIKWVTIGKGKYLLYVGPPSFPFFL
jgi:hypothetical protein